MLKEARKKAGMSREEAASRLAIGIRTLYEYEKRHIAPPDVIAQMAEVYRQPILPRRYCTESCPIGQTSMQPVEIKQLAEAVLGLVKECNDVHAVRDKLIEIAADGKITEEEIPEFMGILKELQELEAKIEALKLWVAMYLKLSKKEEAA